MTTNRQQKMTATTPRNAASLSVGGLPVMENTNQNTPATTAKIEKNGFSFELRRDETKAKAGKEATCYWNLPTLATLAALTDMERATLANAGSTAEQTAPLYERMIASAGKLIGVDKIVEYIESKIDVVMRNAQLDAGKDVWSMDEKHKKAVAFIVDGDFGRNRQGGIGALAANLAATKQISALQAEIIAKFQGVMAAMGKGDTAGAAALQAEVMALTSQMQALQAK